MEGKVRVRFAPSPTGPLHIGGARSALFNWLLARKFGGTMIVRIEDTDLERSSRESEENILNALKWLGLDWDEGIQQGGEHGPYRQTERLEIYREYAKKLLESGQAYYCYCSEEELEAERQALLAKGEMPRYMGKCRNLTEEERNRYEAEGRKPVIRFRVPDNENIVVPDLVRGNVVFESNGIGDYVIVKSDGIPTYNFAVVLDDALMEITHVVRGEEHLSNTPRQLMIYEALGLKAPQFAHVSLILGKDRSKMSKRHGATAIEQYQRLGYLPEALVNFLVLLGWSPEGEEEIFTLQQLIDQFSLDRVAKNPAVFDLDKLNWLNGYYIRQSSVERITEMAVPYLQEAGYLPTGVDAESSWLKLLVASVQEYLAHVSEITEHVNIYFIDDFDFESEEAKEILKDEDFSKVAALFREKLGAEEQLTPEGTKALLKALTKELKLGGKKVYMPLRVALTGQTHGPELYYIIPILGKEKALNRLDATIAKL